MCCDLQDKYEMRTSKKREGPRGGAVVRQFSLIIKDIREEDYGEIVTLPTENNSQSPVVRQLYLSGYKLPGQRFPPD